MTSLLRLSSPSDAHLWSDERRRDGQSIGLVPTMGALHRGHAALIERSQALCDLTVVSIFVNPTQFDRSDDFDLYPRTLDDDLALCDSLGVNAVYMPTVDAMYPDGFDTTIEPGSLAHRWEGEHRPGHFAGVATVVTKLLTAVQPHIAVFGEKDFQQLAVIQHVVRDLGLPVTVVGEPTVREDDGLAMSSRNVHLAPDTRAQATSIKQAIDRALDRSTNTGSPSDIVEQVTTDIQQAGGAVDYVAVVDRLTLEPVADLNDNTQLLVAAWFGGVRLIDNAALVAPE
ncbi:MAG: pantoate--beta-alanine ligase [Ilumatobacteraceae bacterium]